MRAIRWLPAIILTAGLVGLVLVALLPGAPRGLGPAENRDATPIGGDGTPGPAPASPTAAPTPPPALASYVGPRYDLNLVSEPTAHAAQSKVWFHDGAWWAVLVAEFTGQMQIHQLDWATQRWVDTGVLVDERPFAHPDVLWDGERLFVASAGTRNAAGHALRVSGFSYDPAGRRYVLEPDFPLAITDQGVDAVTIAKAQDGQLWVAYVANNRLFVNHTAGGGATWGTGFIPPVPETAVATDRAALVARGAEVVVIWTNQQDDRLYAGVHRNGDPDEAWTVHSSALEGLRYGEAQLSVRALSDAAGAAVFTAIRTSLDRVPNSNADAPQILLVRLDADGTWTQYLFGRVRDGHTGPLVALDEVRGRVYVLAESDGDIYLKDAPLDAIGFASGRGTPLIERGDTAGTPPAPAATDPATPGPGGSPAAEATGQLPLVPAATFVTSTKQAIGELSEVVLLASDDGSGRYAHAVIGLPDGRTPPVAQGHLVDAPPERVGGLLAGTTTYLFRDSFTAFPAGPTDASGWTTRDVDPTVATMTIAEPSAGDPALLLTPTSTGDGPRGCKAVPVTTSGVIIAAVTIQSRGLPESDATITTLRSPLGEVAAVRFGETGTFRYFDGDVRIRTEVPFQPGVWYRSILALDFGSQTYDWQVGELGAAAPMLAIADVPLRIQADSIDEICVQSGNQLPGGGVELYVDDVSVERGPGG
jgi:hypothetical protein